MGSCVIHRPDAGDVLPRNYWRVVGGDQGTKRRLIIATNDAFAEKEQCLRCRSRSFFLREAFKRIQLNLLHTKGLKMLLETCAKGEERPFVVEAAEQPRRRVVQPDHMSSHGAIAIPIVGVGVFQCFRGYGQGLFA